MYVIEFFNNYRGRTEHDPPFVIKLEDNISGVWVEAAMTERQAYDLRDQINEWIARAMPDMRATDLGLEDDDVSDIPF